MTEAESPTPATGTDLPTGSAGGPEPEAMPDVETAFEEIEVDSPLGGMDSLLSVAQMPPGVPVACMAVDGAKNAGVYAARIINL